MDQNYLGYSSSDHDVWRTLYNRQTDLLPNKACDSFLTCLDQMSPALNGKAIPKFEQMNSLLKEATGFEIVVVPGLIEVVDFFRLLANRKFPSSIWLRELSQLDYLAEPDMFHDIFGHIPLLMDKEYARFMQKFGEIGVRFANDERLTRELQRLYWFTVEFGMIQEEDGPRIYGAGIMSSFKESQHVFKKEISYHPFNVNNIINTDFDYTDIQVDYFVIDTYNQMYDGLLEFERISVLS